MSISNFIYQWLKNIVFVFVILTLFKIIMPKGNMKRYMDHIIGLLIIITVVSPLIKLGKNDLVFDSFEIDTNLNNMETNNNIIEAYNDEIEKVYIVRIIDEVEKIVKEKTDEEILDVLVHINTDSQSFGVIKGLDIVLSQVKKDNNDIKKISINKIRTDEDVSMMEKSLSHEELGIIISNQLGINKDLVSIYKN